MEHEASSIPKGKHQPKVVLLSPLPPPEGGVASWTKRMLATDAIKQVHLFHVDTSPSGDHSRFTAPVLSKIFLAAALLLKLIWICLKVRPDAVHITTSGFATHYRDLGYNSRFSGYYRDMVYIFVASLLRRKVVLNLRFGDAEAFSRGVPKVLRPLVRASLRICWCVVPITRTVADEVTGLGCRRVKVIANCIDLHPFSSQARKPGPGNGLRVLFVGWVNPAKGVDELLKALAQVDSATLTIIGPLHPKPPGAQYAEWPNYLINTLGIGDRVELRGRVGVDEARTAYMYSDVLVLPSHLEGFPNVILEAMDAGIPTIATRVGAIPDIIQDEKDGFLMDVGDVEMLATRLNWLAQNPDKRIEMGRVARERVSDNYSAESIAGAWIDLYKDATENDRGLVRT